MVRTKGPYNQMKLSTSSLAAAATLSVALSQTQPNPPPPKESAAVSQQQGDSELGLFAGVVRSPANGGAKFGGGANFAYALNTYIYPYAEFSVLPGGSSAISKDVPATINDVFRVPADLLDVHGGVHIRIPVNKRFVPYGVFGVGMLRFYSQSLDEIFKGTRINSTPLPSENHFSFNYGGGVRYYITNRVGVRFEVKAYGPTSILGGTPLRVMGGIFFQFKKKNI